MSKGDYILNLRAGMNAWLKLRRKGHYPFCPHLSAFLYLLFPENHTYEQWLEYDFAWLDVCDAVLRLPGESYGADQEVERARSRGLPIYYALEEIPDATETRTTAA